MDYKAEQKFILMSPRKLRPVADVIRKMKPTMALEVLPQMGKRAAEPLAKVIKACLANAKQKGISEDSLLFKEILISEGPRLRRGRPVSRGMWHPIKKRMSHIRVILKTIEEEKKTETKSETKKERKAVGKAKSSSEKNI